jgi:phage repressor protein C with HTH and peptisase S24 domain
MAETIDIFLERLDSRMAEIGGLSDRALSLRVTETGDLIRKVRQRRRLPNSENMRKLAAELGVTVDWLVGGEGEPAPLRDYRANVAGTDLPVMGTGHCGTIRFGSNGDAVEIEQTQFEPANVIRFVRRPLALLGVKDAYAIYFVGESMMPRFRPGGLGIVNPQRPPGIGDDVLVQLFNSEGEIDTILVKTLRRTAADFIELEQYNPPAVFKVPRQRVARIHRILDTAELWGG